MSDRVQTAPPVRLTIADVDQQIATLRDLGTSSAVLNAAWHVRRQVRFETTPCVACSGPLTDDPRTCAQNFDAGPLYHGRRCPWHAATPSQSVEAHVSAETKPRRPWWRRLVGE